MTLTFDPWALKVNQTWSTINASVCSKFDNNLSSIFWDIKFTLIINDLTWLDLKYQKQFRWKHVKICQNSKFLNELYMVGGFDMKPYYPLILWICGMSLYLLHNKVVGGQTSFTPSVCLSVSHAIPYGLSSILWFIFICGTNTTNGGDDVLCTISRSKVKVTWVVRIFAVDWGYPSRSLI